MMTEESASQWSPIWAKGIQRRRGERGGHRRGQGGSGTSNGGDGANGIVIVWESLK
jgi:hypothetical protein